MKIRLTRAKALPAILIALVFTCLIWQFGEVKIQGLGEELVQKVSGKPVNQVQKYDAQGVPYQLYRVHGPRYNPLFIAREAQSLSSKPDQISKTQFRMLSDWLLAHSVTRDSMLVCYYSFDLPDQKLKAPWPSALSQAVMLNVFRNRAVMDRDPVWVHHTVDIFRSLYPDSGIKVSSRIAPGQIWWWEYPGPKPDYVLNGMISVLFELWDYHLATGDTKAAELFEQGYQAVLQKLPEFDNHGYSRYRIGGEMAGRVYHQKHIEQLKRLNAIKSDPILIKYYKSWKLHDNLPLPWQFLFNPRFWRILGFMLTWLGLSLFVLIMASALALLFR